MPNPTGFTAGFDSSNVQMAVAEETAWGTVPVTTGKGIRLISESLTETRSRTRPNEINPTGQASAALTTQVSAGGAINVGWSFSPAATGYDDLLKGLINAGITGSAIGNAGNWVVPTTITGENVTVVQRSTGVDLGGGALANQYPGFITATTGFTASNYRIGDWIKVTGNAAAANNGYFRIVGIGTGSATFLRTIAVDGPGFGSIVNAAATSGVTISCPGSIRNGTNVHSFTVEKRLATSRYLAYPGTYISGGSLSAALGGYVEGSLNLLSKGEFLGPTSAAGGALGGTGVHSAFTSDTYDATPAGDVFNTISGISHAAIGYTSSTPTWFYDNVLTAGSSLDTVLQQFSLNFTKNNARQQFGIGSASAKGIGKGTVQVDGTMQMYFSTFTMYNQYKLEAKVVVSFRLVDSSGAGYIITLPGVTLMNPNLVAGGTDTDLVAEFQLEGNPGFTLPYAYTDASGAQVVTPGMTGAGQLLGSIAEPLPYSIHINRFTS